MFQTDRDVFHVTPCDRWGSLMLPLMKKENPLPAMRDDFAANVSGK